MTANHDTNPKRNPRRAKGAGSKKDQREEGHKQDTASSGAKQGNGAGNSHATLSVEEQFHAEIFHQLGYAPDEVIVDSEFHRFSTRDDGTRLDGWYIIDDDGSAPRGAYGDHRTGAKFKWPDQPTRPLTDEERAEIKKRQIEYKSQKAKEQRAVARKAYKIWEKAGNVDPNFPYLVTKNVGAHGRICQPEEFKIIVPVYEDGQKLVSLQFIDCAGEKRFLKGGKKSGCWFELGVWETPPTDAIVICEGYATGATIYETAGIPVIVAFDADNLEPVAKTIAAKYPNVLIIVAGDDDLKKQIELGIKNKGIEKAKEAAKAVNGVAVFPPFDRAKEGNEPSDWNDLAALRGKDKVADIFRQTIEEAKKLRQSDDVSPPEPTKKSGLPEIQIFTGYLARAVDDAEAALVKANCSVMVRGQNLVKPVSTSYKTFDGSETEIVVLKALTAPNLGYMLNKHAAVFVKYDARAKKCVPIEPPERMLTALLQKGQYDLPQVVGVISCPTLRPDGTILDQPGYDPATRLWLHPDPNLKMSPIPKHPTKKQMRAAVQLFRDLLRGYSLETEMDVTIAIAAILAVVCRGAFSVGPLYLFNAHTAGEGKSHLVDLISTIIRGRPCPVITLSGDKAEDEKRLGALLLEGLPIVSLDNCSTNINSDLLCQIATQPLVKVRILSKSETPDCEWMGTMFCTGNNVGFAGDMTRRGLTANFNSNEEQPELRKFDFDPIKKVLADRGKYIAAALTIVRAFIVSGESVECSPLGTFGPSGWSRVVREPLIWAGLPDIWKSTEQARADDPMRKAAREFVALWAEHLGTEKNYRTNDIVHKANETISTPMEEGWMKTKEEYAHPELHDFLVEQAGDIRGNAINPQRLGVWLRNIKGQIHDSYRIVVDETSRIRGNRWRLDVVK